MLKQMAGTFRREHKMSYALYDDNGHIKSSGYSEQADAQRIAAEQGLSVIEIERPIDIYSNIVDTTGTPSIRPATTEEQELHPSKLRENNRAAIRARLRNDRDQQGNRGVADSIHDILLYLELNK